ncbi:DUF488 domain-containing protein [Paenibacillus sp. 1A_MP2]|uniref:DUF488 domain-containing protein n=1 Tax=Paenibacillus sp. 1A_MP2 TaxID=3457495 RepID=UPI003FCE113D
MTKTLVTIGFSKKSLKRFVELLKSQEVLHLIDTRLNNTSQLSGFAKKDDLMYIMSLVGIKYSHNLHLAPERQMLEAFKKKRISWNEYEKQYVELLEKRQVGNGIGKLFSDGVPCFLCSEDKPHHCHRRLLVEYLQQFRNDIKIVHLI